MYPFKLIGLAATCALALLTPHSFADPPKSQASPKTFLYAPMPMPVNGILQYGLAPDGKLTPLKPSLVPTHNSYAFVSATDPKGHFLYINTTPVRQFRISSNGQIVPLKPATVSVPVPDVMASTPNGHFLYLAHRHFEENGSKDPPDEVIPCRVASDGTLHPIQGGIVRTGPEVSSLAVDHTGQFLYVSVFNDDLSGNLAYTREYRINKNGTLVPLHSNEYNSVAAPHLLVAAPSGPFMYMASKSGISTWRILANGTLHLLQNESTFLNVRAFVVDARDDLLIGIGEAVPGADFGGDQLVVWHRLPDGTLTEPEGAFIANDGFLYGDETAMPKGRNAFPVGIVFDSDHQMMYVRDSGTDRIFRYRVGKDGSLRLQAPWVSTGLQTLDLIPECYPLFLGHGN